MGVSMKNFETTQFTKNSDLWGFMKKPIYREELP